MVKNPPANSRNMRFGFCPWWVLRSLGGEDPLEEGMTTTPVFLSGESHGQKTLVGYNQKGRTETDMTKQLSTQSQKIYTRI